MKVVRDFVPVTVKRALITVGDDWEYPSRIIEASYTVDRAGLIRLSGDGSVEVAEGENIRLGHTLKDYGLIYSTNAGIFDPHGIEVGTPESSEPCLTDYGACLFTQSTAEGCCIQRQIPGAAARTIVEPWGGYTDISNPWVCGRFVFCEASINNDPHPDVWSIDLSSNKRERWVENAACPCVWRGYLYYADLSSWPEVSHHATRLDERFSMVEVWQR